jgi:hypothetical protein
MIVPADILGFKVPGILSGPRLCADAKLTCSRQSLCVVNDQPVGNPKRKV